MRDKNRQYSSVSTAALLARPEVFGATIYDTPRLAYFFASAEQVSGLSRFLAPSDRAVLPAPRGPDAAIGDVSDGQFDRAVADVTAGRTSLGLRRTPPPLPTHTLAAPIRVYFEITLRCNAHCNYCLNDAGSCRPDELSAEEQLRTIESFAHDGIFEVRLTGGEPTLHPAFAEIGQAVRDAGMALSVNSNLLDTRRSVLPLAKLDPDLIITSLDASKPAHERSRGPGFEKIAANVRRLREGGLPVRLNCMLNAGTLPDLERFIDEFAAVGCGFCFILTRPVGRAQETMDCADLDDLIAAKDLIDAKRREYPGTYISTSFDVVMDRPLEIGGINLTGCNAIQKSCNVNADGSVLPCAFLYELSPERFCLANVRDHDYSILPIWRGSTLLQELRHQSSRSNLRCIACEHFRRDCLGSCVFMETYSALTARPDPYCRRSLAVEGRCRI